MNIKKNTPILLFYFFLIFFAYESYGKALNNVPIARWQMEPKGTPNSIIMRAETISETNLSYFFECLTAGGHNSGWQASNSYIDSNLTSGATYAYRFKIRYGISGTETAWSTSIIVSTVSTTLPVAGGFDYNWNRYNNSDENVFGIGPITNPIINNSGVRAIYHTPEVGVHPRIYFGPDEIPDILARLKNTASGRTVAKTIHAYTTLLGLGATAYNRNATYARNELGVPYISNVGLWDRKSFFDRLSRNETVSLDSLTTDGRTSSAFLYMAFECLIYKDSINKDLNIPYNTLATKLSDAVARWATLSLNNTNVNPNNYHLAGGSNMAICYDLLYWAMNDTQRGLVRQVLARITPVIPRYGTYISSFVTTSNWAALNSFELITNLAIEGEDGYKQSLTDAWCRVMRNFLVYGWYDTGSPYEDIGKGQMYPTTLIAMARRGYSLLGLSSVRNYGMKFLPAMTQPYGYSFVGTDYLGGTGNIHGTTDQKFGNFRFSSTDAIGLKWIFPTDPSVDFVWRNYIEKTLPNSSTTGYNYGNISSSARYTDNLVFAAIFASDYNQGDFALQAETALGNRDFIDGTGGFINLRSGFDQQALSCMFHVRQDNGGHTAADRNSISFSGLGRIWLQRIASNSDSVGYTQNQSCILVNDQGIPYTKNEGGKSRQPGKILNWKPGNKLSEVSGDATYAYSWEWDWRGGNNAFTKTGYTPVTETRNDFQFVKKTGAEGSYYDIRYYNQPFWNATGPNSREWMLKRLAPGLTAPMRKVFRSVAMVKSNTPFLLVADDVQKDNNINNYKWLGQIAQDLQLDSTVVNLDPSNYRCDIILKERVGNLKLLVRVLQNSGFTASDVPGVITKNWENQDMLVIQSNSIDPKFKIMLYPYIAGQNLPQTKWIKGDSLLHVTSSQGSDFIKFRLDSIGRTNILPYDSLLVLPVSLLNYDAKPTNSGVNLTWTTASEINNSHYIIDRSVDGINFELVGTKPATRVINGLFNYSLNDMKPILGLSYYRLTQVDLNGDKSILGIKPVKFSLDGLTKINLYPNPANDVVTIQFANAKAGQAFISVNDLSGKIILSEKILINDGQNEYPLIIKNKLMTGVYIVYIKTIEKEEKIKLLVN